MSNSPTERRPGDELSVPDISVPVFLEDGRRLHRLRQSSLKDIDICLERARRGMTGTMPKMESDAANIGTACHSGFEMALDGLMEDGTAYPYLVAREAAQDELTTLMSSPYWQWIKFSGEQDARWFVDTVLSEWYQKTLPGLKPLRMEHTFGPLTIYEDEFRVVQVKGTIDYLDERGIIDWKTGSRKHEVWEHERWDIQASTYTWAAVQEGLVMPDDEGIVPFEFQVFWRSRKYTITHQPYIVHRHQGDWDFLRDKCLGVAQLIEAAYPSEGPPVLTRWPLVDTHALCSPKFCPAWDTCKGVHYAPGWPRPSRPA